jgi:hypothetical protein
MQTTITSNDQVQGRRYNQWIDRGANCWPAQSLKLVQQGGKQLHITKQKNTQSSEHLYKCAPADKSPKLRSVRAHSIKIPRPSQLILCQISR